MCAKNLNLIHASQISFLEGCRTTDHIFSLKTLINKYTRENKCNNKLYVCFIDFKKAYDCIWHDGLFSKLKNMNISGSVLEIIKNMYNNSSCAVKIQNKTTRFFHCKTGVRQGCPLRPILFNLYINDLACHLDKATTDPLQLPNSMNISSLIYADDIVIISKSALGLEKLLHHVNLFCETWNLIVNPSKSKCITFSGEK